MENSNIIPPVPAALATAPKIGILTSGGDCPGLNAVIRGVVKSAYRMGYQTLGFIEGFEGLIEPVRYRELTPQNTSGILIQGGTILGSTNRGRFGVTVGQDQKRSLPTELVDAVRKTFIETGLDGLVCVGGDGSLSIALELHRAGLPVVGVPKTIDNDLSCTAFTFGFDSAVNCATDALDRLHTTASSHGRVMVLEVMGRHAGWIALHSGIAGGGDVILIPEIPWTFEGIVAKIQDRQRMGKTFTLIVAAEGAELPGGGVITRETIQSKRQTRLGGIGAVITNELSNIIKQEIRCVVLGHLQRGGGPTNFDRVLATQLGAHAVRLIVQKRFGEMVCYQPPQIDSVPIADAVGELRRVPPDSSAVAAARAMGISFGDSLDYVNPFATQPASQPTQTQQLDR
ncbi:MAG: ATP-dependent 6-phosphofructokinase [Pirellulaceae bacterium]